MLSFAYRNCVIERSICQLHPSRQTTNNVYKSMFTYEASENTYGCIDHILAKREIPYHRSIEKYYPTVIQICKICFIKIWKLLTHKITDQLRSCQSILNSFILSNVQEWVTELIPQLLQTKHHISASRTLSQGLEQNPALLTFRSLQKATTQSLKYI